MPAPGDQHSNYGGKQIANPFEEVKHQVSSYTAAEIATLQSRLEKQLGPEYISSRAGPSGQKVHYVAAEKCIQLANEVFGFNGWSSQIMNLQVDFMDEHPSTLKVSLGLSVIVRVTLRDGTYHEDIGYGHIENCKGKAAAFEKAKKEGTTDGLKRALRNFGNVLGNCIYDKDYLAKVTKVKVQPVKWDVKGLHRHSDYAPVKKEPCASIVDTTTPSLAASESLDDEFGDFDEADFGMPSDPDSHPDEVILPEPQAASAKPGDYSNPSRPAPLNGRSMPPPPKPNSASWTSNQPQVYRQQVQPNLPKTPKPTLARSNSGALSGVQRSQDMNASLIKSQPTRGGPPLVLNQPSRIREVTGPVSPKQPSGALGASPAEEDDLLTLKMGPPAVGFFSAKIAERLPPGDNIPPPSAVSDLPIFNMHAESPSIRRTPGIDHKSSKPTTRPEKLPLTPTTGGMSRSNMINPQLESARRVGAPNSPSPMANRGSYKPLTMKRTSEGNNGDRVPLSDDLSNGNAGSGGDNKRQRL